jgi:transposase
VQLLTAEQLVDAGYVRGRNLVASPHWWVFAPFNHDSGMWRGKRQIWGGRGPVRAVLCIATLFAVRTKPVERSFCLRLINAGKLHKVALVASMHKLLTILNAMARDARRWQPANIFS